MDIWMNNEDYYYYLLLLLLVVVISGSSNQQRLVCRRLYVLCDASCEEDVYKCNRMLDILNYIQKLFARHFLMESCSNIVHFNC